QHDTNDFSPQGSRRRPEGTHAEPLPPTEPGTGLKNPQTNNAAASQPNEVQDWLAQYAQKVSNGTAAKLEPAAGYTLAQLLAKLKQNKLSGNFTKSTPEAAKAAFNGKQGPTAPNAVPAKKFQAATVGNDTTKLPAPVLLPKQPQTAAGNKIGSDAPRPPKPNAPAESVVTLTTAKTQPAAPNQPAAGLLSKPASEAPDTPDVSPKPQKPIITPDRPDTASSQTKIAEKAAFAKTPGGAGNPLGNDDNNRAAHSLFQQAAVTKIHVSNPQPKGRGSSHTINARSTDLDQMSPPDTLENRGNDLSSLTATRLPNAQADTPAGRGPSSISQQILESIRSSIRQPNRQLTINLNPPELGKIFLRLQEQQDTISGLLQVNKEQTRYEIEHALPELIRTLQDSGIQIKRLEVELADQPQQQLLREQSPQNGSFGQDGFADRGGGTDDKAPGKYLADDDYSGFTEPHIMVTNDSISILA
ncbi:MAG: flagellar hook-length control protein FliK, partial [Planctomycetota bacterium]